MVMCINKPIHLANPIDLPLQLARPLLVFCISGLCPLRKFHLLWPRLRRSERILNKVSLEEGALHLRYSIRPVCRIFFEKRLVAQHASDPSSEDDTGPVPDGAAEWYPCWCRCIGVATILYLESRTRFSALRQAAKAEEEDSFLVIIQEDEVVLPRDIGTYSSRRHAATHHASTRTNSQKRCDRAGNPTQSPTRSNTPSYPPANPGGWRIDVCSPP